MTKHKWPLILHEEHRKSGTYMIDLYIKGENEVNVVQLDPDELKVYTSIRTGSWDDPLDKLCTSLILPPKELSILATGDYHEEENKKTPSNPKKQGTQDSPEEDQGNTEEGETQRE